MDKTGVGITSIKSIIFKNKSPADTGSTSEIEEIHLYFINKTPIDVLDCRSKDDYIKQYFNTNKKIVFSNVEILIFLVQPEKKTKKKNQHTLKSKPI